MFTWDTRAPNKNPCFQNRLAELTHADIHTYTNKSLHKHKQEHTHRHTPDVRSNSFVHGCFCDSVDAHAVTFDPQRFASASPSCGTTPTVAVQLASGQDVVSDFFLDADSTFSRLADAAGAQLAVASSRCVLLSPSGDCLAHSSTSSATHLADGDVVTVLVMDLPRVYAHPQGWAFNTMVLWFRGGTQVLEAIPSVRSPSSKAVLITWSGPTALSLQ